MDSTEEVMVALADLAIDDGCDPKDYREILLQIFRDAPQGAIEAFLMDIRCREEMGG